MDTLQTSVQYVKQTSDQLLAECRQRLPHFRMNLSVDPTGMVISTWSYDFRHPMNEWQRTRPSELRIMGGVYNTLRDAFLAVLQVVGRFETWKAEQAEVEKGRQEAQARAQRAVAAAPTPKPQEEQDEGEEVIQVPELPAVTPMPEDPLVGLGGPSSGRHV